MGNKLPKVPGDIQVVLKEVMQRAAEEKKKKKKKRERMVGLGLEKEDKWLQQQQIHRESI